MPAIQISEKISPVLVVTFKGIASDREFDTYLDVMAGILESRRSHAYVLDATEAGLTPMSQQKRQAAFLREHRDLIKQGSLGYAFVFVSPVFRFMLSSIFVVQPLPVPYVVRSTRAEGIAWASAQMSGPGSAIPVSRVRSSETLVNRSGSA